MKRNKFILPVLLLLASCSAVQEGRIKPPLVYRIDIQQGNVVEQDMIAKLRVGMDEKQVKFIMGTPLLIDPFHPERWEYIFSFQKGAKRREQRHITLHFDDDKKLKGISGDIQATHLPIEIDDKKTEKSVVVPEGSGDKTLFEKLMPNLGKPKRKVKKDKEIVQDIDETNEPVADIENQEEITDKALQEALDKTDSEDEISQEGATEDELAEEIQLAEELMKEESSQSDDEQIESSSSDSGEEEKDGFFSRMWDKMTGDEEVADEINEPTADVENKEEITDKALQEALDKTDSEDTISEKGISGDELAEEIELAEELMKEESSNPDNEQMESISSDSGEEEKDGFFSRMWNKITKDEEEN